MNEENISLGKQKIEDLRNERIKKNVDESLHIAEQYAQEANFIYVPKAISEARDYAKQIREPAYKKFVDSEIKRIVAIYRNKGLPKEKYKELKSAITNARIYGDKDLMDFHIFCAKERCAEIGIPLAKSVEDYIRNIPKREGRKIIEKELENAEDEIRKGWNCFFDAYHSTANRIKGLLSMMDDPEYSKEIKSKIESLRIVHEREGLPNRGRKEIRGKTIDSLDKVVKLVKMYNNPDINLDTSFCLSEEFEITKDLELAKGIASRTKSYIPARLSDIFSGILKNNLVDARESLLSLAKEYEGKDEELRAYCVKMADILVEKRSLLSRLFGGRKWMKKT